MQNFHGAAPGRRAVLKLGAVSTFGGALGTTGDEAEDRSGEPAPNAALATPLCGLLGIRHPVLQAPMPRVVTPEMIAAVAREGGLGILPGVGLPPEELRRQIRRVKELSDRPFGVNLLLHPTITRPLRPAEVPAATLRAIQAALDRFRERLGLPHGSLEPPALPADTDAAFAVILEEKVPVFSVALGKPSAEMVSRCHAQGTRVIAMVTTVPDALEVQALGVDAVIAQGAEAGGHRSTWTKRASPEQSAIGSLALVPQVVDAVALPVIAAGGIADGRQLAAALALGASGVLLGTRFVATRESAAPEFYKRALVERDSDATTITDAFTGLYARTLRNAFTEEYRASGAPVLPIVQLAVSSDVVAASAQQGTAEFYPLYAGHGTGMIRDVPAAAEVVRAVVAEAERALVRLRAGGAG